MSDREREARWMKAMFDTNYGIGLTHPDAVKASSMGRRLADSEIQAAVRAARTEGEAEAAELRAENARLRDENGAARAAVIAAWPVVKKAAQQAYATVMAALPDEAARSLAGEQRPDSGWFRKTPESAAMLAEETAALDASEAAASPAEFGGQPTPADCDDDWCFDPGPHEAHVWVGPGLGQPFDCPGRGTDGEQAPRG